MDKKKLYQLREYLLDRLSELSTWQGISFIASIIGFKTQTGFDWGECGVIGGIIASMIRIIFPDKYKKKK